MRKEEEIEVNLANWTGLDYSEEVHEKIQRHV